MAVPVLNFSRVINKQKAGTAGGTDDYDSGFTMTNSIRLVLLAALSLPSARSFAAALRAGTAKTDITPGAGEHLWGYEGRVKPATGALDPLLARVLVLEAGNKAWR